MSLNDKVVTRFAPSPTGFLHIGGARTALFNYLYARACGGKFILRIEDTDMGRNSEEAAEAILKSMKWLGLNWDEGPFYQSRRFASYKGYAEEMVSRGLAYRCFCSPERLENMRKEQAAKGLDPRYDRSCLSLDAGDAAARAAAEKHVIRFKMPPAAELSFDDMVHGPLAFSSDVLDDFVIIKSDGAPTYNFAVAMDDHDMGITHVIRGDDHISNTPKQIAVLSALGFRVPRYAHVPMILGSDKAKLSKRHGATSLTWYEEAGYISEAVVNYLALLGWSLDGTTEFFTMDELVEKFTPERIGRTPSVFDLVRLEHFNAYYLKNMEPGEKLRRTKSYMASFMPDLASLPRFSDDAFLGQLLRAMGDRLKLLAGFRQLAAPFVSDSFEYCDEVVKKTMKDFPREKFAPAIAAVESVLRGCEPFEAAALEAAMRAAAIPGANFSKAVFLLRSALTGSTVSIGIFDIAALLGTHETLERIGRYKDRMDKAFADGGHTLSV